MNSLDPLWIHPKGALKDDPSGAQTAFVMLDKIFTLCIEVLSLHAPLLNLLEGRILDTVFELEFVVTVPFGASRSSDGM